VRQGAARLGDDRRDIVLNNCQRRPHRGNPSDQVAVLVIWRCTSLCSLCSQGVFSRQEFCFDSGVLARKHQCRGVRHP